MTTGFIIIGIIALMQIADDWGLWVKLEHLYNGRKPGWQKETTQN